MIKVAITGGICCGKTTVCGFIEKLGFEVFNSDKTAILLAENNSDLKEKIINQFGLESYINDRYNRKRIASIVFNDSQKLKILNNMFKPFIDFEFIKFSNGRNIVFYESALIFESNAQDEFDFIICAYTNKEVVINRMKSRNGYNNNEIEERLKNQIPTEIKKEKSNYVIDTDKELIEVELETIKIINLIRCGLKN